MYNGKKVIDVHGHLSAPPHFRGYAMTLMAIRTPQEQSLSIPEAAMQQALDRHLRAMDERNIDTQLLSPRPVAMMQWERPFLVEPWTRTTNDVIHQQCQAHPDRFVGLAQLPQSAGLNIEACCTELERAIDKLGFVGALVNPDPASDSQSPGMDDKAWFPLYQRAEQLQATLIVHPSISKDPRLEHLPHSYQLNNLREEALATLLLEHSDVFDRFPKLRIVICHCGGALRRIMDVGDKVDAINPSQNDDNVVKSSGKPRGGSGGVGVAFKDTESAADRSGNLFFDTCAYDPWFLSAAIHQRGVNRMVFGSEAPGSGSAQLNPVTGKPTDDVVALIDSFQFLSMEQKSAIFHDNPLRVFPLLAKVRNLA
jgi:predicted TIM-barrel fold metal-dependent hydrolase